MILVDSCVIMDVVKNDPAWVEWSFARLAEARIRYGTLAINEIVYAEIAGHCPDETLLERIVGDLKLKLERCDRTALFLVGTAFRQYRRLGGPRSNLLPDFFIGAQAATKRIPVLTRDPGRIATYFPSVELVSPHARPN